MPRTQYQGDGQKQVELSEDSIPLHQAKKDEIWIPPATADITSPKRKGTTDSYSNVQREGMTKDNITQEEKLIILFDDLKMIIESDEYDSLRKSLMELYPEYLETFAKIKKDLLKEDHGIVVAGETSSGKSTLINKMLQKKIFKAKLKESSSTICKIRNSEDVRIITESIHGEFQSIPLPDTCNVETEDGQKLLRDTLGKLTDKTSSKECTHFRSVDVGFPISFFEGNKIIVDTPGIGGSGEVSKKLMEYLPNAISFIFVVDVSSAGGMQDNKLPEILRKIMHLQIEDEMPCFDPRKVIFITNKWDAIVTDESSSGDNSDYDEENKTWKELNRDIKTCWPYVKEENIFKMNLKDVSPKNTNASTKEFEKFQQSLKKNIMETENTRLSQHLRFLRDFLKNVSKGIDASLALGKQSEEERKALAEIHKEKINEIRKKCVEGGCMLRNDIKKTIDDVAQGVYDYMSSDIGKDKILNPLGHKKIMEIPYLPHLFTEQIKRRVEMYVKETLQSENIQDKFEMLMGKVIAFSTEISSEISELENDWTEHSEGASDENVKIMPITPKMSHVIASSPLWIPLQAITIGLSLATLGTSLATTSIILPVVIILGRKSNKRDMIDKEYEMCKSEIRSTICNHLQKTYGGIFEKNIKKIIKEILPRRIRSLEEMILELSENRQQILANQATLQSLSRKIKCIQERKLEIQKSTKSIELD